MIRKRGGRYVVLSKSGRRLGTHSTRAEAERQLRAIEANKGKRRRLKGPKGKR